MAGQDEDQGQEKSFEPTPRKLEQAREKGDVARSVDVNAAAAYLGFLAVLLTVGGSAALAFGKAAAVFIGSVDRLEGRVLGPGGLELAGGLMARAALATGPIFLVPAAAVLASLLAQQAIVASTDKLMPKMSRINPIEVAGNKFGPTGLMEFLKSATKMALISTALWWWLLAHAEELVRTAGMPAKALPVELGRMGVSLLSLVAAIAVMIAAVDYLWQRYDHARKLRMSFEDLKKESKESDGDPYMRQARRARAEQIATNQMLQDVPKADVVIVNPTHYAVALKWDRAPGAAPKVVAKGVDEVAAQIRVRAVEAGVPIHSDPPTARTLHAAVEIGREIHPDHYRAVAAAMRFAEDVRRRARPRLRPGLRPAQKGRLSMPADPLEALRRLAELKKRRALAELAAAQRRARDEAEAVARLEARMRDETYDDAPDGAALQNAWRLRGALEGSARRGRQTQAQRAQEAETARAEAATAHARALGAADLQRRADMRRAREEARRAERASGVLAALRRPMEF